MKSERDEKTHASLGEKGCEQATWEPKYHCTKETSNQPNVQLAYGGARKDPDGGNGHPAEVGVSAELGQHIVDAGDDEEVRDVGTCG